MNFVQNTQIRLTKFYYSAKVKREIPARSKVSGNSVGSLCVPLTCTRTRTLFFSFPLYVCNSAALRGFRTDDFWFGGLSRRQGCGAGGQCQGRGGGHEHHGHTEHGLLPQGEAQPQRA